MIPGSGRVMAGVATVVVVIAVAVGLRIAGSPAEARLYSQDGERMRRLWRLEMAVRSYRREHGTLPAELALVRTRWNSDSGRYRDPVTAEPFPYRVLDDSTYTLCAVFARASQDEVGDEEQSHPAGEHCFTRHISDANPPH